MSALPGCRRDDVARQSFCRGPVRGVLQPRNRRLRGRCPRGNQAAIERHRTFAAGGQRDGERVAPREARLAEQDVDVRTRVKNVLIFGVAQLVHVSMLHRR